MIELGEWKLAVAQGEQGDLVAMDFVVIGSENAEKFCTNMPFDQARSFAYGILTLTGTE